MTREEWEQDCRERLAIFLDLADVTADGPPQPAPESTDEPPTE